MRFFLLAGGIMTFVFVGSCRFSRKNINNNNNDESENEQKYSDQEKEDKIFYDKYILPENLNNLKCSPSPYECAVLSKHIYQEKIMKRDKIKIFIKNDIDNIVNDKKEIILPFWEVIEVFHNDKFPEYQGALYFNTKRKLMVLAHQGTKVLRDWYYTNLPSIIKNKPEGQETILDSILLDVITLSKGYFLCITGHSLGGWLAQVSGLMFLNKGKYVKVITFDSPGAKPKLEFLKQRYANKTTHNLDNLDITNYFSSPNLVNCLNEHVGTLYRIIFKPFTNENKKYTKESHKNRNFINAFNKKEGYEIECLELANWPRLEGGEYRKFFKLANQSNNYHPEEQKEDQKKYDLTYKCHYQPFPFDKTEIHMRHLSEGVKTFLRESKKYATGKYKLKLNELGLGFLDPDFDKNILFNNKDKYKDIDIRLIVDMLELFIKDNPEYGKRCNLEFKALDFSQVQPKYQRNTIFNEKEKTPYGNHNLPSLPHDKKYIEDRNPELEKIYNNFFETDPNKLISNKQVIIGEKGIGKSTLARLYAEKYFMYNIENNICDDDQKQNYVDVLQEERFNYKHIYWFHTDRDNSLSISLNEVIYLFNISFNDTTTDRKKMQLIREKLEKYPCWLLIFDNAHDCDLLENMIFKNKGHVLITSTNRNNIWEEKNVIKYNIDLLDATTAKNLLMRFHSPEDSKQDKFLKKLINEIETFPTVLSQMGHYICCMRQEFKDYSYLNFYRDYTKKKQKILNTKSKDSNPNVSFSKNDIYSIFDLIYDKLKKDKSKESLEAIRFLRLIGILDPEGLNSSFFYYLRPTRAKNYFKGWVNDKDKIVDESIAKKALELLRRHGLLLDDSKSKIHRTIQDIIKYKLKQHKKDITNYILDQAIQLLETMLEKDASKSLSLGNEIISHATMLMGQVANFRQQVRLLEVISKVKRKNYLNDLYIPPLDDENKPIHKQVIDFINTKHSLFTENKTPWGLKKYSPLLLLLGDAGTGKSTYGCYLEKSLWEIKAKCTFWSHVPLFISLPEFCSKGVPEDLLEQVFRKLGFTSYMIKVVKQRSKSEDYPWVFIFDGYDETKSTLNLFDHCSLNEWGVKYNKYIITRVTQAYAAEFCNNLS